jgi:hypothetical protein
MTNKLAVAGPDSKFKLPDAEPAGFWAGLWHGSILPLAFIVSLFKPGVGIYETNNNGAWYNFGFLLGASSSLGGGAKAQIDSSRDAEDDESEEAEDKKAKSFKFKIKRKAKDENDE